MRGFTLLEVLAVLAVLGLLLAGLSQGVRFGLRAWDIQAREVAGHGDLEAADRTVRLLVRRIRPAAELRDRSALQGAAQACNLVTLLPGHGADPDMPVAARLEVDAAHRLVLRWRVAPHVTWFGPSPRLQEAVLLDHVERIEFSYWKEAAGGGGAWLRAWADPSPPALVRLRILFPPGDARRWPDIVAAPRLDRTSSARLRYDEPVAGSVMVLSFLSLS